VTALIPVPFTVTRYRCPLQQCGRTGSSKARIADHIARCWLNPEARACKTCTHYRPDTSEGDVGYLSPEYCAIGLPFSEDSLGRPTLVVGCPEWTPIPGRPRHGGES
jgi:hypothetical protein